MQRLFRLMALVFMALAAACGGGSGVDVGVAATTGSVRVAFASPLTAPASCGYDHVYVTVEKVRIYQSAAAADADNAATEVTLSPARRIDLLTLSNGVLEELGTSSLPAGHYTQLRLVLASNGAGAEAGLANAVQPSGGSLVPLDTPGALQSGLKLQASFDVAAGQRGDLILDFDACRSVIKAGNSGRYILKPVIVARPSLVTAVDNSEHRVNTTTAGAQVQPDAAKLTDGGYVIVWASPGQQTGSSDVLAQRYAADGTPVGTETRVGTNTATNQPQPAAAGLADGGYVITWRSLTDGAGPAAIVAQRFTADGSPIGTQQQVNTVARSDQAAPHVAGLDDGGYVVIWTSTQFSDVFPGIDSSSGVYSRRFTADGAPAGPEQPVDTGISFQRNESAIAALGDGGYVVASSWTSRTTVSIRIRRFDAAGAEVVGARTVLAGQAPALAAMDDAGYVITWVALDGFVHAQRYAADGSALGPETRIGSPGASDPAVAALADGGFVVAWVASQADGSGDDVYAQRFASDGMPVGSVTRINTTTASDQRSPAVTAAGAGGFVVTWMSLNQDGDSWGIYARQFDAQGLR